VVGLQQECPVAGTGTHGWADSEAVAREEHAWFSLAYAISNIEPPGFGNGRAIKGTAFPLLHVLYPCRWEQTLQQQWEAASPCSPGLGSVRT